MKLFICVLFMVGSLSGMADERRDMAIHTIFHDDRDLESPLQLLVAEGFTKRRDQEEVLKGLMADPKTRLEVFAPDRGLFPPERGESDQDFWIFCLTIPALSDHLFWVLLDKSGQKQPYIYGFN